ncbi:MAG: ABC transporter permease [Gemmatimonadales bacterium]
MRPGLLTDRGSARWIAASSAIATAAITAVLVAARTSSPSSNSDLLPRSVPFSSAVMTVEALAERAASQLFALLAVVGWGALVVGLVAALAIAADHAARARFEVAIHRAVGASRRVLLTGALAEGLGLAIVALLVGVAVGTAVGRLAGSPWVPTWRGFASALIPVAATVVGTLVLGACFPLWAARTRRTVAVDEEPSPLGFASAQLGMSLAVLIAGAVVIDRTRAITAERSGQLEPAGTVYRLASEDGSPLDPGSIGELVGVSGRPPSITLPGGHLGLGAVDELITECGQCLVGGIFLRFRPLRATYLTASADTFEARGLTITDGRAFTDRDRPGGPPVAIVNTYLARRYFENGQPLGRSVFLGGKMGGPRYQVVGVVDDRRGLGLGGGEQPLESVYLSSLQHPGPVAEVVLAAGATLRPSSAIRVVGSETTAQMVERATSPMRWFGRWFMAIGAVALLLAIAGTAALMALWVRSLRAELALRRAVGARRRDLVFTVGGGAMRTGLTGVGVAITVFGPMLWPNLDLVVPGASLWQPAAFGIGALVLVGAALVGAGSSLGKVLHSSPAELWSAR